MTERFSGSMITVTIAAAAAGKKLNFWTQMAKYSQDRSPGSADYDDVPIP